MEIKRDKYVNKLISHMNNGMIKVITGMRRCGKSYLLFNLFRDHLIESGVEEECIISISLDDDEYAECRDPGILNEYIKGRIKDSKRNYYIFIDEAQYAISREEMKNTDEPLRLYGVLNGLLRKRNADVYITGSNSRFLSSDVMTEFRGRGDEIHISPLSFSEYLPASGKDKYEALNDYLIYGGLPHILSETDDESKSGYLNRIFNEIYLKDIYERYNIKEGSGMRELTQVLASSVGSLTNAQKIADTFKSSGNKEISMPTVAKYLSFLLDCFMVRKAERYDVKGRRYISTPSKFYYSDTGIRNALLNFRQFEETHLMENVIYNELIYRGFNVDVGVVETRADENGKRIRRQLEIDFVINKGSKRYYIQSAFALPDREKIEQEQASLIRVNDSFKKMIVVKEGLPVWRNEEGITIMNLYDFLLDENSLDS